MGWASSGLETTRSESALAAGDNLAGAAEFGLQDLGHQGDGVLRQGGQGRPRMDAAAEGQHGRPLPVADFGGFVARRRRGGGFARRFPASQVCQRWP